MDIPARNLTDLADALPAATRNTSGVLALATAAEVAIGEDDAKAVTPKALAEANPITPYTPVLLGGGTPWTPGNGTIVGNYFILAPGFIAVSGTIVIGSTSVVPSGEMQISLPYPPKPGTGLHHGSGTYVSDGWAEYAAIIRTGAGSDHVSFMQTTGFVTSTSPRTVGAADVFAFSVAYPY